MNAKISAARPVVIPEGAIVTASKDKYINYTPSDAAPGKMAGKQRVIRMVDMAVDPLEPPKFKHKKVPNGPPSPPVPVMHSPPRKLTVKDQQAWKIPPVVSNWKNAKGYTIPLDKRLAADGRTLQQATINDKFATLSEALYVAERKARSEVEMRAEMAKRMMAKEKEQQEAKLRELAAKAREERAGLMRQDDEAPRSRPRDDDADEPEAVCCLCFTPTRSVPLSSPVAPCPLQARPGESASEREARLQREMMRRERKREREREMRQEVLGKKTKTMRDRDRDISEKIALGMQASGKLSGEAMFDQRLFNQVGLCFPGCLPHWLPSSHCRCYRSERAVARPQCGLR